MNKITFALLIIFLAGCSSDNNDCQANKDAINKKYDDQIQYVKDHPGSDGIDYRQITLLNEERNKKLETACD